jgi:hypothetical protein
VPGIATIELLLIALALMAAIAVTVVAVYEWTGLPRHWHARWWNTALAAVLWGTWFYIVARI